MTERVIQLVSSEGPEYVWLSRPADDREALGPGPWAPAETPRALIDFTGEQGERLYGLSPEEKVAKHDVLEHAQDMLVSDRLLTALVGLDPEAIRYTRVETLLRDADGERAGPHYWLLEVLREVDALDYEKSHTGIETRADGRQAVPLRWGSMIFRKADVNGAILFRQRFVDGVFIAQTAYKAIENAGILALHHCGYIADSSVCETAWCLVTGVDQIEANWLNSPTPVNQPLPHGPLPGQPGAEGTRTGLPAMERPPRFQFDLRSDADWLWGRDYPEAPIVWQDILNRRRDLWLISDRLMRLLLEIDAAAFDCVRAETTILLDEGEREGPAYWLCDLVRVVDAIDLEKSNAWLKEFASGLFSVEVRTGSEVFRKRDLGDAQIFHQLNRLGYRTYLTDAAKKRIEQGGFVGVDFMIGGRIDDDQF